MRFHPLEQTPGFNHCDTPLNRSAGAADVQPGIRHGNMATLIGRGIPVWNTHHMPKNKPEPGTAMGHGLLLRVGNEDWEVRGTGAPHGSVKPGHTDCAGRQ